MNVSWLTRFAFPVFMLLLTAVPILAQEERRGFIGLGIGPSAPFSSFADTASANTRAGRATPGYTSTLLNLGYRFGERFGMAAALSYSEYYMRDDDDDDWWQVAVITAGPLYSHLLNNRTAIDLKAMVGMIALTPVIDSYTTIDGTGSGLVLDMRATIRYDVFRRWAVFAEGGLQAGAASFGPGAQQDVRAMISGFGVAFRPTW